MWSIFTARSTPKSFLHGGYNHIAGRIFTPGAESESFTMPTTLPVIVFRGNARLAGQYAVYQPPQVMVPQIIGSKLVAI